MKKSDGSKDKKKKGEYPELVLIPGYVSLTGSEATGDESELDIVEVRAQEPIDPSLHSAIRDVFIKALGTEVFQISGCGPSGPFEPYLPVYDLILRPVEDPEVQEPESMEDIVIEQIDHYKAAQPFGSVGGKSHVASRILKMIPEHKTYVEGFAGGAAIFWRKEPSETEVLNDKDPDVASAYRFIKGMTDAEYEDLKGRYWIRSRAHFEKLKAEETPKNPVDRFYRFIYIALNCFRKIGERPQRWTFAPSREGNKLSIIKSLPRFKERLAKVKIHNLDFDEMIQKYDSEDTFFFLDPPYPGADVDWKFPFEIPDCERMAKTLKKIKGKFLITIGLHPDLPKVFKGFRICRMQYPATVFRGTDGGTRQEYLISNYAVNKAEDFIDCDKGIKQLFGSPGGKHFLAGRIVKFLPEHKRYVEPFCGGAAVFWRKSASEEEVISDIDPDIIAAYKYLREASDEDIRNIRRRQWVVSRRVFERLLKEDPSEPAEKFYRQVYLAAASYGGNRKTFNPGREGKEVDLSALERQRERLKKAKIFRRDWKDIVKDYDSKDTLFYLDPPYPKHLFLVEGEDVYPQDSLVQEIKSTLGKLKGNFILSLGHNKFVQKEFGKYNIRLVSIPYYFAQQHDAGTNRRREYLISNLPSEARNLYVEKNFDMAQFIQETIDRGSEDPLLYAPDESRPWRYTIQHHYRGKSAHADIRFEYPEYCLGWTLMDLVSGAISAPVETLAEAKKTDADRGAFKVDWKNGVFQEVGQGDAVKLQAVVKPPEPSSWLDFEGIVNPGEPGATQELPGVYSVLDTGLVEYGAQRPDFHEYFLKGGKTKGRLIAWKYRDDTWLVSQPQDQTPYVLSDAAIKDGWLPPILQTHASALPKEIRDKVPAELQYWKLGVPDALEARKKLAAILNKVQKRDAADSVSKIAVFKLDDEKHLVYGIVYEPNETDTQGDYANAEDIEKACHKYLAQYDGAIGIMHQVPAPMCRLVENYLAPVDFEIKGPYGTQKVKKGSWIIAVYVPDDKLWSMIKSGDFSGFSMQGEAKERVK